MYHLVAQDGSRAAKRDARGHYTVATFKRYQDAFNFRVATNRVGYQIREI
jgi:hypothetical protein